MSPEVEKAKLVAKTLRMLLCQHNLIKSNVCFDINIFELEEENVYYLNAGLEIVDKRLFHEKGRQTISLKNLIEKIIKFTGIDIKYKINNNMAPSVCFFSIEDLNKLFDLTFLMSRIK